MPSRTLKRPTSRRLPSPWTAEPGCSERELPKLAERLARELRAGDRVLLEGEMGVGKTTFARHLLHALGVVQPPEGSPTFAIVHEYRGSPGEVIHIDLYRIRYPEEIDETGIPAYFWERTAVVICEWASMWPEFEKAVLDSAGRNHYRVWEVRIDFDPNDVALRSIRIFKRPDRA